MSSRKRWLPTPSMVVACVALAVAMSGGAYAVVASNQVVSSSIKNGAVKNVDLGALSVGTGKIKNGAVTFDKLASNAKPRWALVKGDGTILAQSGGISVANANGIGGFYLNFGSSQEGRLVVASNKYPATGELQAGVCGGSTSTGPLVSCSSNNTTSHVFVGTYDSAGNATPTGKYFYVATFK